VHSHAQVTVKFVRCRYSSNVVDIVRPTGAVSKHTELTFDELLHIFLTVRRVVHSGVSPHRPAYTYPPPPPLALHKSHRICIDLRNDLGQKWGGHVHPSPPRGDATV